MDMLVVDPNVSQRLIEERRARGADHHDEVWEGTYVMAPAPNDEHQQVATRLTRVFVEVVEDTGKGQARASINLASDPDNWQQNYRVPDVVVFLNDSPAACHDTFWSGPPDFVIEIVSPWDKSREKLKFYGEQGTRELLLIDRDPWQVELYRESRKSMRLAAKIGVGAKDSLKSDVLPIEIRLSPGKPRPVIEITDVSLQRSWTV